MSDWKAFCTGFKQPFRDLARVWCWWRGHKWSRAYVPDETAPDVKEKRCTRCGAVRPVKRRMKA